jgi:hypothetical protein
MSTSIKKYIYLRGYSLNNPLKIPDGTVLSHLDPGNTFDLNPKWARTLSPEI